MTTAVSVTHLPKRFGWALTAVLGASVLSSLDLFIVNLAFPQISSSFPDASPQSLSWVLNAYLVAFAALLAPAGRLADHYGRRRMFQLGLVAFLLGTVAASLAPGVAVLIAARGLQGLGSAIMVPTSLALLLSLTDEASHKRMLSVWAAAGSVAAALGPVLGGVLADLDWRWVFLIKVPFAVIALVGARALPQDAHPSVVQTGVAHPGVAQTGVTHPGVAQSGPAHPRVARSGPAHPRIAHVQDAHARSRRPDLLGAFLLTASIAALVTVLSYWSEWFAWPEWMSSNPWLWGILLASVVALVLFVLRSRTHPEPSIDLRVFRNGSFIAASVGMAAFYLGFSIMLLGGALWATNAWGWSSTLTGLAYIAGPGVAVISALLVGQSNLDARWFAIIGGTLFALCGLLWIFTLTAARPDPWVFIGGLVLTGAGAGIGQTGFLAVGTAALPAEDQATAAGIVNTARQIGAALGVAILIAIVGAGLDPATYRHAWLFMAAAGAIAALSPLIGMRPLVGMRPPIGMRSQTDTKR